MKKSKLKNEKITTALYGSAPIELLTSINKSSTAKQKALHSHAQRRNNKKFFNSLDEHIIQKKLVKSRSLLGKK